MVTFGQHVFAAPSETTDDQVDELRDLGYTDEQIAEVVGLVALNVLTRRLQPGRRDSPTRKERSMSSRYLEWAAAVGAAGCGRCAAAA